MTRFPYDAPTIASSHYSYSQCKDAPFCTSKYTHSKKRRQSPERQIQYWLTFRLGPIYAIRLESPACSSSTGDEKIAELDRHRPISFSCCFSTRLFQLFLCRLRYFIGSGLYPVYRFGSKYMFYSCLFAQGLYCVQLCGSFEIT